MLNLLADIAAVARATHVDFYTAAAVKVAAQLEAAQTQLRYVGGVAVVHAHEHATPGCSSECTLVAAPPPMLGDPHRAR